MAKKIEFLNKIALDEKTRGLVVAVVIVAVTLILSHAVIYKSHVKKIEALQSNIEQETILLSLRKSIAKTDQARGNYSQYLHKSADTNRLRDIILDIARDKVLDVISISPLPEEKFGDYGKISFSVKLRSSYNSLGRFIDAIERQPLLTVVEEIVIGGTASGPQKEGPLPTETNTEVSVIISAYYMKAS